MSSLSQIASERHGDPRCEVTYEGQRISCAPGARLLDVILEAGFDHRHVCGGNGFCTSCRVRIEGDAGGLSPVSAREIERLGKDAGRLRLACQSFLRGNVAVDVPAPEPTRFSPYGD